MWARRCIFTAGSSKAGCEIEGKRGPPRVCSVIELAHLRAAAAAAEHGSIRKAAFALGVQQSTVSRRLRELERGLGFAVFDRPHTGALPSRRGRPFLEASQRILAEMDELVQVARTGADEGGPTVRLGASPSVPVDRLHDILAQGASGSARLDVMLSSGTLRGLVGALRAGRIDVALMPFVDGLWEGPTFLLWSEPVLVALSQKHEMARRPVIERAALAQGRILASRHDPTPRLAGVSRVVLQDAPPQALLALVGAGYGAMLIAAGLAAGRPSGVVFRPLKIGKRCCRISFAAYHRVELSNPAITALTDLLRCERRMMGQSC